MFKFLNFFKKESPKQEEKSIPFEQQPHIIEQHERNFEFLKKVLEKYPINTWTKFSENGFCDGGTLRIERFQHPEVPFVLKCDDFYYSLGVECYYYPTSHEQSRKLYKTYVLKPLREEQNRLAQIQQEKLKTFEKTINL